MKKRTKKTSVSRRRGDAWQGRTLPDYLRKNLDIVFVGLNPGLYSAEVGHYFANKVNRFWEALSASGLVPDPVGPEDDARLMGWGIGLTDIVKRPTGGYMRSRKPSFVAALKRCAKKLFTMRRVSCASTG